MTKASLGEGNREIRRKVRLAWGAGDRAVLEQYIHPKMVIVEPDCLPYRGTFIGIDGYIALHEQISAVWDEMTIDEGDVIGADDGDAIVIEYFTTARCRSTGVWIHREPNLALWKFEDGMIVSMTPFNFDTAKLCAAMGVDPICRAS